MVDDRKIKKVIFITLTHIGDVAFTLPSLDYLKNKFENASFTVLSGPAAASLFADDPRIKEYIPYNKYAPSREKFKLFNRLRKENFDVIIDLRNTIFRCVAPARFKNPYVISVPKNIKQLRLRHLYKTKTAFKDKRSVYDIHTPAMSIYSNKKTGESSNNLLKQHQLSTDSEYIVVAPGARSSAKCWQKEGFVELCDKLLNIHPVILIGSEDDCGVTQYINKKLDGRCVDLAGQTNLSEVIELLKNAKLVICHDSGILHISSYLNLPILAIFGLTDEDESGPSSEVCAVVRKNLVCVPCLKAQCKFDTLQCMKDINPEDVFSAALDVLNKKSTKDKTNAQNKYKRILIIRTDRIGDVVLTTPMIKAIKDAWPNSYVSMMVAPAVVDILKNNPYLDEIIVYDKKNTHRGVLQNLRFILELRRKKFDLALVVHTKNRTNIIAYLSGIKERIGYEQKFGLLLTKKLSDTRPQGLKHESEYCLDLLRALGIEPRDKTLFMSSNKEDDDWAESILKDHGVKTEDLIIAIHPGASSPSRRWPIYRFTEITKVLLKKYKAKIVLLGGAETVSMAGYISDRVQNQTINLVGQISISQLASILKRCTLLISNISGPAHIAVVVGTPVVSIFSMNDAGVSPVRWKTLGKNDIVLHKNVGCKICHAHNCNIGFACLKAITTGEVLEAIDKILKSC